MTMATTTVVSSRLWEVIGSVGSVRHSEFTRGEFIGQIFRARVADDCSVDIEFFTFVIFDGVVEKRRAC